MSKAQQQAHELQEAIRAGQVEKATKLAKLLAQAKALVVIHVEDNATDFAMDLVQEVEKSSTPRIRLKVYLDSSHTNATMYLDVDPTMTFGSLKLRIHEQFGFQPEGLICIVGDQQPANHHTLLQHGLCFDDAEVNVYEETMPDMYASTWITQDVTEDSCQPGPSRNPEVWRGSSPQQVVVVQPDLVQHLSPGGANANFGAFSPALPTWSCSECTYENYHSLSVCEMCETPKRKGTLEVQNDNHENSTNDVDCKRQPESIEDIIDCGSDEINKGAILCQGQSNPATSSSSAGKAAYNDLMAAEFEPVIVNTKAFDCPICFSTAEPGEGVVLRECLHTFCKTCLASHIGFSENAVVTCPFNDGSYKCQCSLQDREIREIVSEEMYEKHLRLSAREAEGQASQSYHCKTPDCTGWCTFEDDVKTFFCYACRRLNCLSCETIHEGETCQVYQKRLRAEIRRDPTAFANASIEQLLKFGDAMKCPSCSTIIIKTDGCDWVLCTVCKTEICWVTQQPRWGPKGHGDISGGCRCRVNGKLCHPNCQNCH